MQTEHKVGSVEEAVAHNLTRLRLLAGSSALDEDLDGEQISQLVDAAYDGLISQQVGRTLRDFDSDRSAWAAKTFGPERPATGPAKHLVKEAQEFVETFGEVGPEHELTRTECADCLFLVLAMSDQCGMSLLELIEYARRKLVMNKNRSWPEPTNSDEPVFHTGGEEMPGEEKIQSCKLSEDGQCNKDGDGCGVKCEVGCPATADGVCPIGGCDGICELEF